MNKLLILQWAHTLVRTYIQLRLKSLPYKERLNYIKAMSCCAILELINFSHILLCENVTNYLQGRLKA